MNKLRNALYRFMYGRYGNDQLTMFILILTIILFLLNAFLFQNSFLSILIMILLFFNVLRTYSKNIVKRRNENRKFLNLTAPLRKKLLLVKHQSKDAQHKYFICPQCSQSVRVPKGRGKITITCPKCTHRFDRKS